MADRRLLLCVVCLSLTAVAMLGGPGVATPTVADVDDRPVHVSTGTASETQPACSIETSSGDTHSDRRVDESDSGGVAETRIVELYPNPTTDGNAGEYLVVETPPETRLDGWTITDGHTTATVPNETVSGRVALSTDVEETASIADEPVVELDGTLRLAVDGDELTLENTTDTIDRVAYTQAPIAERWYREDTTAGGDQNATPATGEWWPREATCLPVSTGEATEATAFVLPDSPEVPTETIRSADDRLLVAGYTFTDRETTDALVDAAERGVDVAVLVESGPVGGAPEATRSRLDRLSAAGVDVRAIGGEGSRYRFHHPKYLVADDTALVMSENWKPAGVGGASSRGWGVRVNDATLAADLETVFHRDFEGWDTDSGDTYLDTGTFVDDEPPTPREFDTTATAESVSIDSAELLLAPDNAEPRLEQLIDAAEDELLVKQASVNPDVSLLESTIDAAERGVSVRLLLDSSWYVEDDHERLQADLERTATRDDLDLDVRLVDDTDRFEKIHAKGIVIDRETAVVGSANWNPTSLQENREVLLALHGEEVGEYYASVFDSDWEGETWSLPIGLSATVVLALGGAAIVGRRYVRFGDESR